MIFQANTPDKLEIIEPPIYDGYSIDYDLGQAY